ncbi:MAG: helix-turn-helix transcriptional regulator [Prevotella sp.]|nr:helix-turn-helix transcriptional regulator [Prevotella sp.]
MKDRIRQIMETQHMTQQVFAQLIELAPATLSSIFNGRTRPTLNVVEAIKKKIPDINTEWLLFGTGKMYASGQSVEGTVENQHAEAIDAEFDFGSQDVYPTNLDSAAVENAGQAAMPQNSVRNTRLVVEHENLKKFDKGVRRVTEIRVFYDDLTYESFVPAKK